MTKKATKKITFTRFDAAEYLVATLEDDKAGS